ncbi:AT-hook motif nuclear-localized protein 1-like [Solanum pennellii]|uniref:AT-hook motif nuclear-localized protein n=1 Tax=Solanum pennellii TaxID=28526 RepID=A0ABM1G0Z8_SOLPN|nr:AT-hook motif nuclear-localized protein 1-like [Solanum pennellii]
MENVGSTSAADDNTPAQPISSSTPLVPSFPDPSVSTTESRKRGRPSPGMTTPSPSQVAGGLSSPTQPQADGSNPGMTTPPPSQVAGGGLSSSAQPQADETAVSTGNKQQSVDLGSEVAALGFMQSHVINIKTGEDILVKIMSFCESTSKSVCVLSANGSTSSVSLRRPYQSVTYKGVYDILSLTGFFFVLESGGRRSREGGLTAILGNEEDGDVWGGNVDGLFTAATDVQVIVSSFSTGKQVQQVKSDNFGTPATLSPMSVGSLSGSVSPDSPLIVTSKRSPTGVASRLPF